VEQETGLKPAKTTERSNKDPAVVDVETPRRWSLTTRALTGLLAAVPPLLGGVLIVVAGLDPSLGTKSAMLYGALVWVFGTFVALMYFGRLLWGNERLEGSRTWLSVAMVLFPPITLPLYWWYFVWKSPPPDAFDRNQPGGQANADRRRTREGHAPA
jgi:hypothetical protein